MQDENGKYLFGICKVGEKGQIVIPKEARDVFGIRPGDLLVLLGDKTRGGIAVVKAEVFSSTADAILGGSDDSH